MASAETAAPPAPVLEATDLKKSFRTGTGFGRGLLRAVDGVSISVRPGEALGIVGESGCGKSTLARMLVGLEKPDSGTVTFEGIETGTHAWRRSDARSRVQMIFQDPYTSLDPRMTVLDLVGEPLAARGLARGKEKQRRVAEVLQLVGMDPAMMRRFPHQFSGGQRQRLGIARALILDPSVLVCDEPVSALDVSIQAQVVNLLAGLKDKLGIALVFIAHDLSVVRHIADRVAVMYLGKVCEVASTEQLFSRPRHPYTSALLSAAPSIDRSERGRLASRRVLIGDPPSPVNPPSGCRFHPRCWMAQDTCRTVEPLLRPVDDGGARRSACHFAEQVPAEAQTAEV